MKIFISHSARDKEQAKKIASKLKNANLDVWYDEWSLQPGDSLVDKIEKGIADSNTLLVLLSKESLKSRWVKSEINAFLNRSLSERNISIIPVLLEKVEVPPLLRDRLYIDLTKEQEVGLSQLIRQLSDPFDECSRLPEVVLIDDFNRGILGPNRLGGLTLVYHENGDPSSLRATFINRGRGKSIALSYDFTPHHSPSLPPQFVGYATRLQFSNWKEFLDCGYWLSFDASTDGNARLLTVEIKRLITPPREDTRQEIAKWQVDLPLEWTRINLRLRDISYPELPWDNLWEICFVLFRDNVVGDKGLILIDNLCLEKQPR